MISEEVSQEVWEQDGPIGGSVDGETPGAAVAVVSTGITLVREAPPLRVTWGKLSLAVGTPQRIGREPRRRRLLITTNYAANPAAYCVIGDNAQQVASGYGMVVGQGVSLPPIHSAAEIWFAVFTADFEVGFCAELDEG